MDVMVTARMPQSKKENGNEVLSKLGTNASAVINNLYDFVIANGALPFPKSSKLTKDEIARRVAQVNSIPLLTDNRFAHMSDDEIKYERLGLA